MSITRMRRLTILFTVVLLKEYNFSTQLTDTLHCLGATQLTDYARINSALSLPAFAFVPLI